jgi:hypothetical protein
MFSVPIFATSYCMTFPRQKCHFFALSSLSPKFARKTELLCLLTLFHLILHFIQEFIVFPEYNFEFTPVYLNESIHIQVLFLTSSCFRNLSVSIHRLLCSHNCQIVTRRLLICL